VDNPIAATHQSARQSRQRRYARAKGVAKAMVEIRELAGPDAAIFLQLWMSRQTFDDFEPEQKAKFQELVRRWMQLDSELAAHQLEFPQLQ
jgi:DNA repair exonuclease SbcCD ATPase subunit